MTKSWAVERRLDYIAWKLIVAGRVNREDLIRVFDISMPQASNDIGEFLHRHPGALDYDKSRKCYVNGPEFSRHSRGMGAPQVLNAIWLLGEAGHPMAWS